MNKQYYSPSVNIIRDQEKDLKYIVTKNAKHIAESIAIHFETVNHCFNIIGSYGTGKSSFIWALEQNLTGKKDYFFPVGKHFKGKERFCFINVVGSHNSIVESLGEYLGVSSTNPKEVLDALNKYYQEVEARDEFLFIVIDEYGKFLEFASKNNSEENIYFLQQLAEFVNDETRNIVLLTSLHQNFSQYGVGLGIKERNEWLKVSGRFIDLTFNEPLDQLLYLASERISEWSFKNSKDIEFKKITQSILDAKIIRNTDSYNQEIGKKLWPFDIASAVCMTWALQQYGQNERSLFTFLNRREKKSLYSYAEKGKHFDLSQVHDFLVQNFGGFIVSSTNPDKNKWQALRTALDMVEAQIDKDVKLTEKIVKTIGLLSIFSNPGGRIDHDLICSYFVTKRRSIVEGILKELEHKKIIRFRKYTSRFILFEGTDLDFEQALLEAEQKLTRTQDIASNIKRFYQLPCVLAKAISYKVGTPRFFDYQISNKPIKQIASGELDGTINLVFSYDKLLLNDIIEISEKYPSNIYAFFKRTEEIGEILFEIEKVEFVKQENQDDRVAIKELDSMKAALEDRLGHEILSNLTTNNVDWYRGGIAREISSYRKLNMELSVLCEEVYSKTPIIRNELINKHKVSGSIATARKNYMRALIKGNGKEDIGFAQDKYPAEKTIFLSLLKNTGIYQHVAEDRWEFSAPEEDSPFFGLWNKSMEILNNAKNERINVQVFFDELSEVPFKLKEGFLSFWVPTFLFIQQNNFALFNDKGYLPFLSEEVFELLHKNHKHFWIKTFSVNDINLDLLNTYRTLMNKPQESLGNRSVYIETIRPLLVFYRDLPQYTQNTRNLTDEAIKFRGAIAKAQDPETAFFNDIPHALGYTGLDLKNESIDLNNYLEQLRNVIRELRDCEQNLLKELEGRIISIIGATGKKYGEFKEQLEHRFDGIDNEIIAPHLKRLLGRIIVPVSSKTDWIKGLFNSLFTKSFNDIKDEEIGLFIKKFTKSFKELERLVDLHQLNETRENESICAVDIIDKKGNVKKENIVFTKIVSDKYIESEQVMDKLMENLNTDECKALLFKKLQELI